MQESKKATKVARQLKVDFDRARLHSLIEGCFRRKGIPTFLRGKDLIRGTIIGILEKSYDFETAVEKATQKCTLNGYTPAKQEAMYDMAECFINGSIDPTSTRQKDIIKIEKILEGIEKDGNHLVEDFVQEGINGLLYDIRKVFCYTTTMGFMKDKGMNMSELSVDIIKNMVFKKLMADDSTSECMYEYAFRSSLQEEENDINTVKKVIDGYCEELLPKDMDAAQYAETIVDEIYSCKATSPH